MSLPPPFPRFPHFLALFLTVLFCGSGSGLLHSQRHSPISDYERQIIASTLVLEAAGCGEEGMRAVLNVIFNRANRQLGRVVRVTVRPGQFTSLNGVTRQRHPDYTPVLQRAMRDPHYPIAYQLVRELERGHLHDNVNGADHFHAKTMRYAPAWAASMERVAEIGGHYFFRSRT